MRVGAFIISVRRYIYIGVGIGFQVVCVGISYRLPSMGCTCADKLQTAQRRLSLGGYLLDN